MDIKTVVLHIFIWVRKKMESSNSTTGSQVSTSTAAEATANQDWFDTANPDLRVLTPSKITQQMRSLTSPIVGAGLQKLSTQINKTLAERPLCQVHGRIETHTLTEAQYQKLPTINLPVTKQTASQLPPSRRKGKHSRKTQSVAPETESIKTKKTRISPLALLTLHVGSTSVHPV